MSAAPGALQNTTRGEWPKVPSDPGVSGRFAAGAPLPAGQQPRSLQLVAPRKGARKVVLLVMGLMLLVALALTLVPWQQQVTGRGQVIIYSAMERPQNVEAQIPGRLVRWDAQEGSVVKSGEILGEIEDIDSKFLDPNLVPRLEGQMTALKERLAAAQGREVALARQVESVNRSRGAQLPVAGEQEKMAEERLRAAREALTGSDQSYQAARDVSLPSSKERVKQGKDRLEAAQESLVVAEQTFKVQQTVTVPSASERASQAIERLKASQEALIAAQQSLKVANEVTLPTARERAQQALQAQRQAEQSLQAAKEAQQTARLQRERVQELFKKGLRSKRDDELAQLDLVRSQTEVERADAGLQVAQRNVTVTGLDVEKALADLERSRTEVERSKNGVEIARKDISLAELEKVRAQEDVIRLRAEVGRSRAGVELARKDLGVAGLEVNRAGLDVVRAGTEVERARAAVQIARRDATVGDLTLARVEADTEATISSVEASLASVRETIQSINGDILKQEVEIQNTRERVMQRVIRAPSDGRLVRVSKAGTGETVKAGDVLCMLMPETLDHAVELYLSPNDAPLAAVGRPVRLQFAGFPALQFTGWPAVAVGTYAGRVAVVDAVDDGGKLRVIVKPDQDAVKFGKDQDWPGSQYLRPGAEAVGWVMLDTVSLGYELWRQFNAFPPTAAKPKDGSYGEYNDGGKGGAATSGEKADDGKKFGEIKRKAGK